MSIIFRTVGIFVTCAALCVSASATSAGAAELKKGPALAPPKAPAATQPGDQKGKGVSLKGMSEDKFKALPDNTPIDLGDGQILTKGQIMSQVKEQRDKGLAENDASKVKSKSDFESKRKAFLASEKTNLESSNARLMAKIDSIRKAAALDREIEGIQAEARQLSEKYKNASPAEKSRIDKRAGELNELLNKKGLQR